MYCSDCTLLVKTGLKAFHIKCCQFYCISKDSTAKNIQETQISVTYEDKMCLNSASAIQFPPVICYCYITFLM